MTDILAEIVAHKQTEVAQLKAKYTAASMAERVAAADPARGFLAAIARTAEIGKLAVIAELKQASPSRGTIREHYDPESIALSYQDGGATCLSVLTDERWFRGSTAHLQTARNACSLPVLRKEFIIDPIQIDESRAIGADCILLIAACLGDGQMSELYARGGELGLDVLVEVHNREELERAHVLRSPLIGINNRDLKTFTTSIETTLGLLPDIFPDRIIVTESGIGSSEEVRRLRAAGVHAFLVGTEFMSAPEPGARLRELFS